MPVEFVNGINFGYAGGYRAEPLLSEGLTELYNLGFRKIRIVMPVYTTETSNPTLRDQIRNVISTALAMGFDQVICGYTVNGASNLTATTWNTYRNNLLSFAAWADALGYQKKFVIALGNEDDPRVDGTTLTTATYQSNIRALSDTIHSTYTSLLTSYTCTTNFSSTWRTTPGSLDLVGLNVYSTRHTFHSQILGWKQALGGRGIITEWQPSDNGYNDWTSNPEGYMKEMFSRLNKMSKLGLINYFYSFDNSGAGQTWALRLTNGTTRKAFDLYRKKRTFLVDTYRYPTIFGE